MGALIDDAALLEYAGGASRFPDTSEPVRTIFRLAADEELRGALRPRYIVPADWSNPFAAQVVADLAIYRIMRKVGFDPKVDKEIVAAYTQAHELLAMARKGEFSFGLVSRRRVFSGAPTVDETGESGWL